jgi:hypothetical protein
MSESHRERLERIARDKRWTLNVAAQAAVEALEREEQRRGNAA